MARQIYSLLLLTAQPTLLALFSSGAGAGDGTRTRDLLITNQLLYQLSYASDDTFSKTHRPFYRRCRDGACAAAAEELRVIANGLTGRKRSLIPTPQEGEGGGPDQT